MKYLSVCSGIEAATVAWHELGWQPVGFSEIEKFPNAVLEHHYPDVPNYGDMTDHEGWPTADLDVLVGGTPCQSFSVAGLRKGMADPRGNLALIYLAIADQYRPRWLVWENVPGVLSSDGGRDFGSIIGGMVELGYCPAWRVLDAQYFGVPQRRRRVFVVASSRDWRDSAAVLFEPESLLRNPAPSREPRQGSAGDVAKSTGGSSGGMTPMGPGGEDISHALSSRDAKGPCSNLAQATLLVGALDTSDGLKWGSDQWVAQNKAIVECNPVTFNWQNGGGYGEANEGLGIAEDQAGPESASQVQAVAYGLPGNWIGRKPENGGNAVEPMKNLSPSLTAADRHAVAFNLHGGSKRKDRPDGGFYTEETDVAKPLDTAGINPTANQGGTAIAVAHETGQGYWQQEEYSGPLRAEGENRPSRPSHVVMEPAVAFRENQRAEVSEHKIADALLSGGGKPGNGYPAIRQGFQVRRLMPIECERLQGFPDNYTNIPGASDSARYKALGNSMAVPVMYWIGKRINDYEM